MNEHKSLQEFYNKVEKEILEMDRKYGEKIVIPRTDDKITKETKSLIKARNCLREKEEKTTKEKIEPMVLEKMIKKEIRKDLKKYRENEIEETLKTNGSIREAKKVLVPGRHLRTHVKSKEGEKITGRKGIV